MTEARTAHDAFIDDILADPDDDVPRLLYADWLDDHGAGPDVGQEPAARSPSRDLTTRTQLLPEMPPGRSRLKHERSRPSPGLRSVGHAPLSVPMEAQVSMAFKEALGR